MDVTALYPSLDSTEDSKVVEALVTKHAKMVDGVCYPEVGRYLALTLTHDKLKNRGLVDFCPTRKYTRGQIPGITTPEVNTPLNQDISDSVSKLNPAAREPTPAANTKMLGAMF